MILKPILELILILLLFFQYPRGINISFLQSLLCQLCCTRTKMSLGLMRFLWAWCLFVFDLQVSKSSKSSLRCWCCCCRSHWAASGWDVVRWWHPLKVHALSFSSGKHPQMKPWSQRTQPGSASVTRISIILPPCMTGAGVFPCTLLTCTNQDLAQDLKPGWWNPRWVFSSSPSGSPVGSVSLILILFPFCPPVKTP